MQVDIEFIIDDEVYFRPYNLEDIILLNEVISNKMIKPITRISKTSSGTYVASKTFYYNLTKDEIKTKVGIYADLISLPNSLLPNGGAEIKREERLKLAEKLIDLIMRSSNFKSTKNVIADCILPDLPFIIQRLEDNLKINTDDDIFSF